jgi:hypothetical protein
MSPNAPARVHVPAKSVERFDQVVRYMLRHGGQARFGYTGEVRVLSEMKGNRVFRRVARDLFNQARLEGFNQ